MPSPLQDTLFLLLMEPERPAPLRDAAAALPRSLAEFFSIVGEIPLGQDGFPRTVWNEGGGHPVVGEVTDDYWIVGLPALLADYWAADVTPLAAFLGPGVHTDHAADDADTGSITELPPRPLRGPLRLLFTNETRDGRAFVELDGSDDPPVHEHFASTGWGTPARPFSAWLFTLFADGYVFHDWAPCSFWGPNADLARSEVKAPLQLFKSGLWLRARGPLTDDARAALVAEFSEYDVRPYDDSTLEQFIDDDAAIWIVGATCWWLWADDTAALARIATLARTHGELGAFIADTRDARTVLADLG